MGLLWGVKGIKGQKVEVGGPGGEEENETSVGKKGVSGWRERLEGKTGGRGGASMGHKGGPVGGYWGSKWGSGLQRSGRKAWGVQGTLGVSKWGQQGGGRRKREDGGPRGADRGESEGGDGWRGQRGESCGGGGKGDRRDESGGARRDREGGGQTEDPGGQNGDRGREEVRGGVGEDSPPRRPPRTPTRRS